MGEMAYLNDIANSPDLKDLKLKDVIKGADVFAGLAGARILSPEMLSCMKISLSLAEAACCSHL